MELLRKATTLQEAYDLLDPTAPWKGNGWNISMPSGPRRPASSR